MRGNVVDLAVAFVIGAAFGALVVSFVEDLLTPLIAAIFGEQDFSELTFTINDSAFRYGSFINALIAFVSVAAAVFFVVKAYNAYRARLGEEVETRNCPECQSQISVGARRCAFCTSEVGSAA